MKPYALMIQTDSEDRFITESAMSEIEHSVSLKFLDSISQLDEHVKKEGEPALILLNDGGSILNKGEFLQQLKTDPAYNHIPVVLLGEKSTDEYIRECYRAGANSFIVKPSSLAETKKKISLFFTYWFDVAEVAN